MKLSLKSYFNEIVFMQSKEKRKERKKKFSLLNLFLSFILPLGNLQHRERYNQPSCIIWSLSKTFSFLWVDSQYNTLYYVLSCFLLRLNFFFFFKSLRSLYFNGMFSGSSLCNKGNKLLFFLFRTLSIFLTLTLVPAVCRIIQRRIQ